MQNWHSDVIDSDKYLNYRIYNDTIEFKYTSHPNTLKNSLTHNTDRKTLIKLAALLQESNPGFYLIVACIQNYNMTDGAENPFNSLHNKCGRDTLVQ